MADTTATKPASQTDKIQVAEPRVSVVMPVYNDLRFLDPAVDSVLHQSFRDLELIIVDDGTGQDAVFARLAERDPRIRIVVNRTNVGTAAAGNRGIAAARADIIAPLDADDISEPLRIERLVAALDADPELGLVGTWFTTIDEAGAPLEVIRVPETDLEIRWAILFYNPLCHSSVAYRRSIFEAAGGYETNQPISADHYLWSRMLALCRARNLPEALVRYRLNPRGLTASSQHDWRPHTRRMRETSWAALGVHYDVHDDTYEFELAQFVLGYDIARAEGRARAHRTILELLRRFLAAASPFVREEDAAAAHRLAQATVARILTDRTAELSGVVELGRLAWPIDRRATGWAFCRRLAAELGRWWRG